MGKNKRNVGGGRDRFGGPIMDPGERVALIETDKAQSQVRWEGGRNAKSSGKNTKFHKQTQ